MASFRNGSIVSLQPNEVFVFGSNLAGRHGAGAARLAYHAFGAAYGIGRGLVGNSYALPTKDKDLRVRSLPEIRAELIELAKIARCNPDLTFYLTAVGTGLAGIPESLIISAIKQVNIPDNVIPWWKW